MCALVCMYVCVYLVSHIHCEGGMGRAGKLCMKGTSCM